MRECACGCGLPIGRDPTGQRETATPACRTRMWRRRVKAGTVIPQVVRLRVAQEKRVGVARRTVEQAEWEVQAAQRRLKTAREALRAEAARLDEMQPELALRSREPCPPRSQRAAWRHWVTSRLGTMPDAALADLAGVTPSTIARRRRAAGVPPHDPSDRQKETR